jgi:hypothetical protein
MNTIYSIGPRRHIKPYPTVLGLWDLGISALVSTRQDENAKTDVQETHTSVVVYCDDIATWQRRFWEKRMSLIVIPVSLS